MLDVAEHLKEHSLVETMVEFPAATIKYHNGMRTLKRAYDVMNKPSIVVWKMENFTHEPLDLSKSVVLWGASNIGKTYFALAHFQNPVMVTHLDDLLLFDPKRHDGLVFDELTFTHLPVSQRIGLVDLDFDRSIHIRYTTVIIPKGTKRIFTNNLQSVFIDPRETLSFDQADAINRRLHYVEVRNKLY